MLPLCRAEGIGVIPCSPLARGFLAGNRKKGGGGDTVRANSDKFASKFYFADADFAVADRVGELAARRGVSRMQVALAWLLSRPGVTAPIVGASKLSHLDEAIDALDVKLTPEECTFLEETLPAASRRRAPVGGGCSGVIARSVCRPAAPKFPADLDRSAAVVHRVDDAERGPAVARVAARAARQEGAGARDGRSRPRGADRRLLDGQRRGGRCVEPPDADAGHADRRGAGRAGARRADVPRPDGGVADLRAGGARRLGRRVRPAGAAGAGADARAARAPAERHQPEHDHVPDGVGRRSGARRRHRSRRPASAGCMSCNALSFGA